MRLPISLFCLVLLTCAAPLRACGFFIMGDEYRVALFNPYLIGQEYELFFYSSEKFHPGTNAEAGRDRMRNVTEWADELGGEVTPQQVLTLIYQTDLGDWRAAADGQPNETFKANPAWSAFSKRPDLLTYMLWAKEYEKSSDIRSYWWLEEEESSAVKREDDALRRVARKAYGAARPGSFVRKRWAYQLLLMAYYADDLPTADRLFTEYFDGDGKSVLADWARFHMANFYTDPVRKTVMLANAFRVAPEKAHAVWRRTAEEFNVEDYLPQASNDYERSNLYALAAAKMPGRALPLIEQAYKFDPTNPVLDLLMSREINKLEDWLMTFRLTNMAPAVTAGYLGAEAEWPYDDLYPVYSPSATAYREKNYARDRAYLSEVRFFADQFTSPQPRLTPLYRAHLALLDEDYDTAIKLLPAENGSDPALTLQRDMIYFLAALQRPGAAVSELKELIALKLPLLEEALAPPPGTNAREDYDNNFYYYGQNVEERNRAKALVRASALRLEEEGDTVSAYFVYNQSLPYTNGYSYSSEYYALIDYLDRDLSYAVLDGIISLLEQPQTGRFEKMLRENARVEANAVRDVAGTVGLRRNNLARARDYFQAIPGGWHQNHYAFADYLDESPFTHVFTPADTFPGKTEVVSRLITLEETAARGGEVGARAAFDLANAWYNMSYYGNSWMMLAYGRSNYLDPGYLPWPFTNGHSALPHNATDYRAIQVGAYVFSYLDRARPLTDDAELIARIEYLGGMLRWQSELNERTKGYSWSNDYTATSDSLYRENFGALKESFATTRFYQTVVGQCETFADL